MLLSSLSTEVWILSSTQLLGLAAAFVAHRTSGTALQNLFQIAALLLMGTAGLAGLLSGGSAPERCVACGTMFACMVLMATFDRRGLGLKSCPHWTEMPSR